MDRMVCSDSEVEPWRWLVALIITKYEWVNMVLEWTIIRWVSPRYPIHYPTRFPISLTDWLKAFTYMCIHSIAHIHVWHCVMHLIMVMRSVCMSPSIKVMHMDTCTRQRWCGTTLKRYDMENLQDCVNSVNMLPSPLSVIITFCVKLQVTKQTWNQESVATGPMLWLTLTPAIS